MILLFQIVCIYICNYIILNNQSSNKINLINLSYDNINNFNQNINTNNISPLRYPGGKTRACKIIDNIICQYFNLENFDTLLSPFFGGGSFEFYFQNKYKFNYLFFHLHFHFSN